ncbi:hypothetical protein L596_026068 [Steinernema carpocapsae]|uniref:Uncharacterized protein n=1 Tax=Steinernema carpocapsae TaxID=34508 RepID=A0A4U5M097_STECR|nr:hypothetical protein L596_026068 [Steinernema carpocapsae]
MRVLCCRHRPCGPPAVVLDSSGLSSHRQDIDPNLLFFSRPQKDVLDASAHLLFFRSRLIIFFLTQTSIFAYFRSLNVM